MASGRYPGREGNNMKSPIGLAMWIVKFVFTLVLFFVVIPAGLFFGGTYAYGRYEARQADKAAADEYSTPIPPGATTSPTMTDLKGKRVPIPAGATVEKYPLAQGMFADELEARCPYHALVTADCQSLYTMPKDVSCIGKPFVPCMIDPPKESQEDLKREWERQEASKNTLRKPCPKNDPAGIRDGNTNCLDMRHP